MAFAIDLCQAVPSAQQLLTIVEQEFGRVNNFIGQLNSFAQGVARSARIADIFAVDVDPWKLINNCPSAQAISECFAPLFNTFKFGGSLGFDVGIGMPCLNLNLPNLLDIHFSCLLKSSQEYQDLTGRHPNDDLRNVDVPTINPVTNLRYTRQGVSVLLTWDDDDNDVVDDLHKPFIYRLEVNGFQRWSGIEKSFLLPGLTPGRPTLIRVVAQSRNQQFESAPADLTVIAFDSTLPCNVTDLTVAAVGVRDAVIRYSPAQCPNVVGYNVRWKRQQVGDAPEYIYWVGQREEVVLAGILDGPTLVTVTTVTEWDESDGVSILITPQQIQLLTTTFDQVSYSPGDPLQVDFEFNLRMAPAGIWHKAWFTDGVSDIPVATIEVHDAGLNPDRIIRLIGNVPVPIGFTQLKLRFVNAMGDEFTQTVAIP